MKRKSLIALGTVFFLGAAVIAPTVQAAKSTQVLVSEPINLEGKTYIDLDKEGKDLASEDYEESILTINEFTVKDENIRLKGEVAYEDEKIPFDFEGELAKGRKSDKVLVGKLTDKDKNFDVIHFSIDNDHRGTISIDKKKSKKAKNDSELMFKLYLLKKGTRDFIVFEEAGPSFVDKNIFNNVKKLKKTDHIEQFWYAKILKPRVEVVDEEEETSTEGEFSTMALHSRSIITRHQFFYDIAGDEYTETFRTKRVIEGPQTITHDGEFTVKFYVTEEETTLTDIYGNEYFVSDDTSTYIGRFDDTIVQGWVEADEVIRSVEWDGNFHEPDNELSISIGWEVGLLGASVGVESSWSLEEDYEDLNMQVFDNSGGDYTKNAAVQWKEDYQILKDVGHTFDHVFRVGTYDTSGSKDFSVRISYTIDNPMDEVDSVRDYDRDISLPYDIE